MGYTSSALVGLFLILTTVLVTCVFHPYSFDILETRINHTSLINPEAFMTTPEIIKKRGYPIEVHYVTTEDGYILELHRIPSSSKSPKRFAKRKPVFLQHGIFASDHVWLIAPSDRALAFILADRGFDVWLGNARGSTYSRKHVHLSPDQNEYWNFSWDHKGKYDLPACINYILNTTGQEQLHYIGHSLGSATIFIAMNEYPELNEKIEALIALHPVSRTANMAKMDVIGPIFNTFRVIDDRQSLVLVPHDFYFWSAVRAQTWLSNDSLIWRIFRMFCLQNAKSAAMCRNLWLFTFGDNPDGFDMTLLHAFNGHFPSGGSLHEIAQGDQNRVSDGVFVRCDFGDENLKIHGVLDPPVYNLTLVTAPVYVFWAENDPISPPQDVAWTAANLGNVKAFVKIDDPKFTHMDFAWSTKSVDFVHRKILHFLNSSY